MVNTYYTQFTRVATDEECQRLSTDYHLFIDQLTPDQQAVAREAARPYLLEAVIKAEKMEPILQQAKDMLSRRQEPA